MELRHLRYFIAVAEEENVSRAALRLHVSQPALSRQIHDLEAELGFPLLERTAKSVKLTEAGRFFLEETRSVMQHLREALKRTRAIAKGESGEIHVGYAPSLTVEILPRTLRTFQSEFPKVRVCLHDLSTEEMLEQLQEGKLTVALVVQPSRSMLRGLEFEELEKYPVCVVVSPQHPFAKLKAVPMLDLVKEQIIAYSRHEYPEYYDFLDTLFAKAKSKPHILEEHDGVTSLTAAVESGRGIALAPSCLEAMVGKRLKFIPVKPSAGFTVVGAVLEKETLTPAAEKFIEAARKMPEV